jgi:hypothetical protein
MGISTIGCAFSTKFNAFPLLQYIPIDKQIRQQGQLPSQTKQVYEMKIPLSRFMAHHMHRTITTCGSTEKGQKEQVFFRNTPRATLRPLLIDGIHEKGKKADRQQNNKPRLPQHQSISDKVAP